MMVAERGNAILTFPHASQVVHVPMCPWRGEGGALSG